MTTATDKTSVLSRKLRLARGDPSGGSRSLLRALRQSLGRVAAHTVGLQMSVIGATQVRRAQDDLAGGMVAERLHLLLSEPDGRSGAVSLDRSCVSAIIQQQTMGHVRDQPPPDRAHTDTDAAMVTPFVDGLLPRALELCETPEDRRSLQGFQVAGRVGDPRSLLLALEDERYRVVDLTLEIAGGRHQGQMTLILPQVPDEAGAGAAAADGPRLERSFGAMRADLDVVVSRLRLPLGRFASMRPGDTVPLLDCRLDRSEVLSIDGRCVALARLGQCRGMRAIRLNEAFPDLPADRDAGEPFSDHLPAVIGIPEEQGASGTHPEAAEAESDEILLEAEEEIPGALDGTITDSH
ncbi:flagellar motor switch protein FliM [Cribrihabitans marinus]|uniref:Flagellar motor switch protein FliM n=1 Tax=Cribrihabitans marinus TaxID=1227549 RepID=A0A1H6TA84_9RHOB|nr:FliM/FliN family flagellar motor switch protein [Cribrihabitans marinus]GGH22582.1 flagellar switch protein FliM [Cribrihabitans marinus]SEI73220.1 flagellar motor switch protein FliM [Cribrihabitans marinus]